MKRIDVSLGIVVENMSTTGQLTPEALTLAQLNGRTHDDLAVLITRRKPASVLGGYWELPGGKVEPDESLAQCLVRELIEEIGVEVEPLAALDAIEHQYEHAHVRLLPFICRRVRGLPKALQVDVVRWVLPEALSSYPFPPANAPLIAQLARALGTGATEPIAQGLSLVPLGKA